MKHSEARNGSPLRLTLLALVTLALWSGCGANASERRGVVEAGVRTGSDYLQRRLFLSLDGLGSVTDIQYGALRSRGTAELGIAGNYGARFFDRSGTQKWAIVFHDHEPASTKIVNVTNSSKMTFFRQKDWNGGVDSLVDSEGHLLWSAGPCHKGTFGYIEPEGNAQFFLAKPDLSVEARNVAGNVLWKTPDVGVADAIGLIPVSPKEMLRVLITESGALVQLNASGQVVSREKPGVDGYFSDFLPIRWRPLCSNECLLSSLNNQIVLLSIDAQHVIAELGGGFLVFPTYATVKFHENEPPFLAASSVVIMKRPSKILMYGWLYIFDPAGKLVYSEVLPEAIQSLSALPTETGKSETLLVGGENKVWEYCPPRG